MAPAWKPLGRILRTPNIAPWGVSHASYPIAHHLEHNRFRIYFSSRDGQNRSSLASIEIEIEDESFIVVGDPTGPYLSPGEPGFFDADGVTLSSVVEHGGALYGFYLGWTVLKHVLFANFIGSCISEDGGVTFRRLSTVPTIGRSKENPISLGYPFVIRDGNRWRMWYGSHISWTFGKSPMLHVIKEAFSDDLVTWKAEDRIVLNVNQDPASHEFALSRPCVIREADQSLSMWYAVRRPNYAIGYAVSRDTDHWERRDESVQFLGQPEEWESEERTYPFVFDHNNRRYMLYNGNGYGREGFGIAILTP